MVFATCNEINRLSKPLQSRFRRLHLPKYSREQFLQVAVKVCTKLSEETALIIAEETWAWKGVGNDPRMFFSSTRDGVNWTDQKQVGGGTSNGPALFALTQANDVI